MTPTVHATNQYYICDEASADSPMQAWKNEMLAPSQPGECNYAIGRTVGFNVDGRRHFGRIVLQRLDIRQKRLLVFDVVSHSGKHVLVDLRDAVDIFDGVVVQQDLHTSNMSADRHLYE